MLIWGEFIGRKPGVRLARAFAVSRAGSVAIEFSLIGLACFGLVIETMQAGMYFYTSSELNNATAKAMRQVMTGTITQQGLTATQFRTNILCPYLPSVMPCSSVVVNMRSVAEDVYPNVFYKFVNSAQTAVIMPTMDNNKTSFCSGCTILYSHISQYRILTQVSLETKMALRTVSFPKFLMT